MTRTQLLTPGEYIALPKSLAKDTRIGSTAKLVWAVLADRLGKNAVAWPKERTIAADAGISATSAKRAVAELERTGWLSITSRSGKSNSYTLLLANPDQNDPGQLESGQSDPGQTDPTTGTKTTRLPGQSDPTTRVNLSYELLNRTTEEKPPNVTTEERAAVAAPSSASPSVVKAEGVPSQSASKRIGKLTDEQKEFLCSSPDHLTAWYCFGWDAVGKPQTEWAVVGQQARTNWAPSSGEYNTPESGVHVSALAAWSWLKICYARAAGGLTVALPIFKKLIGVIQPLRDRMTHQQFVDHVTRVTTRWPEIQSALGSWGQTLILDESILAVPQVLAQSERIAAGQSITPTTSTFLQKQDFRKDGKYAHCYSNQ